MNFKERPLAITDVETTGLDHRIHEIVEIGLVLTNQKTLEVYDKWESKVIPMHLETASPLALQLNGYNKKDWEDAILLHEAIKIYAQKTKEAMFLAHNVTFDWRFMDEAFHITGIKDEMDYHRIDLFTTAWVKDFGIDRFQKMNLDELCKYFEIEPEPKPHRGINGALKELEVLKKLLI